jgi:nucleoside-diphosphate-sugar epimerase
VKVLVTGGAGFIGSHLVRGLLDRGDEVVVLDDFSTGRRENLTGLEGPLRVVEADLQEPSALESAVAGCDGVLHHAAEISVPRSIQDPVRCTDLNVTGTVSALEAARRAGAMRFVLASSCAVYGDAGGGAPRAETDELRPISPYAASKLAAEQFVTAAALLHGMGAVSLRYFNVYGARQDPASPYAAVVPKFIEAHLAGRSPTIFGDGRQTRDFVHVADVVRANLLALEAPAQAAGRAINVGTGSSVDLLELAGSIGRLCGSGAAPDLQAERAGDLRHSRARVELAEELLGFKAANDLEAGLKATLPAF